MHFLASSCMLRTYSYAPLKTKTHTDKQSVHTILFIIRYKVFIMRSVIPYFTRLQNVFFDLLRQPTYLSLLII